MKFKPELRLPYLGLAAYGKELHRVMQEAIGQATMEWLDTVLSEIPIWSGASRATFLKLANEIHHNVDIAPVTNDRISQGLSESSGKITAKQDRGEYTFSYGTTLPWLVWNEYHNANTDPDATIWGRLLKPGPYMFQVKGAIAFQRFAATVRLPSIAPFIKSKRIM